MIRNAIPFYIHSTPYETADMIIGLGLLFYDSHIHEKSRMLRNALTEIR